MVSKWSSFRIRSVRNYGAQTKTAKVAVRKYKMSDDRISENLLKGVCIAQKGRKA